MKRSDVPWEMSIVIPTYNRADSLPRVLSRLTSYGGIMEYIEVIIVDDGSTDRTHEIIEGFADKFRKGFRFFSQSNTGAAAARNLGIKSAKGTIILFLDSDIIPSEDLLVGHKQFHQRYASINFALRGGTKMAPEHSHAIRNTETYIPENNRKDLMDGEYQELCWDDFVSCNISLKRQFLVENGFFDEKTFAHLELEDVELGYRLYKKGLRLFHSNKAMGFHWHPCSLQQYLDHAERHGKSLALWYAKAPEIRKEIIKIGRGSVHGFLSLREPGFIIKYLLRTALISRFTVKMVVFFGNIFMLRQEKLARYFYRQAYQYYHRKAFEHQLVSARKERMKQGAIQKTLPFT